MVLGLDSIDAGKHGSELDVVWASAREEGVLVAAKGTIHPPWA